MPRETLLELLHAQDYREFLGELFQHYRKTKRNFSYAEFSRRAGFAARSFPRDVIGGGKSLSSKSLSQFVKTLQLRGELKQFFLLLVYRCEPHLDPQSRPPQQVLDQLQKLKTRLLQSIDATSLCQEDIRKVFRHKHWMGIYAACGTLEKGASIEEIVSRTGLPQQLVKQEIFKMTEARFVSLRDQRVFPLEIHLAISDLGQEHVFRETFLSRMRSFSSKAERDFDSKNTYFFASDVSVSSKDFPELRRRMHELLLEFVDRAEVSEGDRVASLAVAFGYYNGEDA